MDINRLLANLPPLSNNKKTIEDALASYGGFITANSFDNITLSKENIAEIDSLCKNIILANRAFQRGQIIECYNRILEELKPGRYSYPIFKICEKKKDSFFYRMRACDEEYLYSKEELFHIPFEKRQKISNQRFSLSGYPCLYLGSSIYICWEELNRPQIDNANIVGVKLCRPIKLIDLRIPLEIQDITDYYRIPLIIACSVQVREPMSPYKPEYVISQALLHALIYMNNKQVKSFGYNGIIYYSSRLRSPQRFFLNDDLFENIVIPTINNTQDPNAEVIYQDGFCPVLCNTFELTEPISLNKYRLCKDVKTVYVPFYGGLEEDAYQKTILKELEGYIQRQSTFKITPCEFFRLNPDLLSQY